MPCSLNCNSPHVLSLRVAGADAPTSARATHLPHVCCDRDTVWYVSFPSSHRRRLASMTGVHLQHPQSSTVLALEVRPGARTAESFTRCPSAPVRSGQGG